MGLKFRAWDTYNEAWADEYLAIAEDGHVIEIKNDGTTEYWKDRFIIEFGTGLKDKNGEEICEGDIIREKWYDSDVHMGRDRIGKIEYFCDGFICWFKGSAFVGLGMFPTKNIEVIGNIHENLNY